MMIDEELNFAVEEGMEFSYEDKDHELDYGEAWDLVDKFLKEDYEVEHFWQHRTLIDENRYMSGFVNGVVWVAEYYDDEGEWLFDFMTYETYEEYYN
jgi:hypothetical protein